MFLISLFLRGGLGIGSTVLKVLNHPKYTQFVKAITTTTPTPPTTTPLSTLFSASEEINKQTVGGAAANGALMRTSIIGIYFYQDLELAEALAIAFCKVNIYNCIIL